MTDLTHISVGNDKTECFSFDIPARLTCPGKTEECSRDCYAAKLMALYPAVDKKYARNHEFAVHTTCKEFTDYMIREIPPNCDFRIHASGDFFHRDYVHKWLVICAARADVTFYAYTRSWRIPEIWSSICDLHTLPNVNVNLSVDDETGAPDVNFAQFYRWCYLTKTDNVPDWIRKDDIVFRSNHLGQKMRRKNDIKKSIDPNIRSPLVKRLGGLVCPFEQGQDVPGFSCKKCTLCVVKPRVAASV